MGKIFVRILLILSFLNLSLSLFSQLKADFSYDTTQGCAPLSVQFSDQSTGSPVKWKWDMGDGTFYYVQNPKAVFRKPGTYSVKLVIENATRKDSVIKTGIIRVFELPATDFRSVDTVGCYPFRVRFNDVTSNIDGRIVKWEWNFGDGNVSEEKSPIHVYQQTGLYTVSLRVTNSLGCSQTLVRRDFIRVPSGISAGYTQTLADTCTIPITARFTNTSTGLGILTYRWSFGDGTQSTEASPSHIYSAAGSFPVRLTVTNNLGCVDTASLGPVVVGAVASDFQIPASVCQGTSIKIRNLSFPTPVSTIWTFGNGSGSAQFEPELIFDVPRTYTIRQLTNFGSCTKVVEKRIVVNPRPKVDFTPNTTLGCQTPFVVQFANSSTGATRYRWLFGDGDSSNAVNPSKIYSANGTYSVSLLASNDNGCADSLSKRDLIRITRPTIRLQTPQERGCIPFVFRPVAVPEAGVTLTNYRWDFGDGTSSTEPNPSHTYNLRGNYTIKLYFTSSLGCADSILFSNAVKVGTKPVIDFSVAPSSTCLSVPIAFSNLSTGTDEWFWDFGDGKRSRAQNPSHVYDQQGNYSVKLVAGINGCTDSLLKTNIVSIGSPIADFRDSVPECALGSTVYFKDNSIGATSWNWDFGDGSFATDKDPVHAFPGPGVYNVRLTIKNGTCEAQVQRQVTVVTPRAGLIVNYSAVCRESLTNFRATSADNPFIVSYFWDFGDGTSGSGPTPSHRFQTAGRYNIRLTITDIRGCIDTLPVPHPLQVRGVTAAFSHKNRVACLGIPSNFIDQSKTDGLNPVKYTVWDYGDGTRDSSAGRPPVHTYQNNGTYTVTYTIADVGGCVDTERKLNFITVSSPKAAFASPDSLSCPGKTVRFADSSSGVGLTHKWEFGNGGTSTLQFPQQVFSTNGQFDIKLKIQDIFGCVDSVVRQGYVTINSPKALMQLSDSIAQCPPLKVDMNNQSTYYSSFRWNFGDSINITDDTVSQLYSLPGNYRVKLEVTSPGGCIDSIARTIQVKGPNGSFTVSSLKVCRKAPLHFEASSDQPVTFHWNFDGTDTTSGPASVSYAYDSLGTFLPRLSLVNAEGCRVTLPARDSISVHGAVSAFGADTSTRCDSAVVQFMQQTVANEAVTSYHWLFGDGGQSTMAEPVHNYLGPGNYHVVLAVKTASGCTDTAAYDRPFLVATSPQFQIQGDSSKCMPALARFEPVNQNQDSAIVEWKWDFGNGSKSNSADPAPVSYMLPGDYNIQLIVINNSGCSDTVMKKFTVLAAPYLNIGPDKILCLGSSTNLSASGAVNYEWEPAAGISCLNCPEQTVSPSDNTLYVVKGTNDLGCSSTDSLFVRVKKPFEISVQERDSVCQGDGLKLFVRGAEKYDWSPATDIDNSNSASPTVRPTSSSVYQVIGTDSANCFSDTALVSVEVFPYPSVEAGSDFEIMGGNQVTLQPVVSADVTSINWTPSTWLDCVNCLSPVSTPKKDIRYTIEVRNSGGCVSRDFVTVRVFCNNANLFVPNTFSPNGDGRNDIFYPEGKGLFNVKSLRVFNRWGELVFEQSNFAANDPSKGWNGTIRGSAAPQDVYIYAVEVICENQAILKYKGNVMLMR